MFTKQQTFSYAEKQLLGKKLCGVVFSYMEINDFIIYHHNRIPTLKEKLNCSYNTKLHEKVIGYVT